MTSRNISACWWRYCVDQAGPDARPDQPQQVQLWHQGQGQEHKGGKFDPHIAVLDAGVAHATPASSAATAQTAPPRPMRKAGDKRGGVCPPVAQQQRR